MTVENFFALNRPIILFLYGQVFFVLGLAIFLRSRRRSRLKLARDLRWLAAFGVLHGIHEWGMVFIPIQMEYLSANGRDVLLLLQVWFLAISFFMLLLFGYVLLEAPYPWIRVLVIILASLWVIFWGIPGLMQLGGLRWAYVATIWARYLLGFPGAILSAYGLYRLAQQDAVVLSDRKFHRNLRLAGFSLLAYGFFGGLLVAPASFFPANLLNYQRLEPWIGIPVEVFRSLAGLILAISMIRALEIFEVEVDRQIEAMEVEAIRASERDRIGQEIHDGAMQGAYSVALILNSLMKFYENTPIATARLAQAQQVVEKVIYDLRSYMTSLRQRLPASNLTEALTQLVSEPRFRSLVDIDLDLDDSPDMDGVCIGRLLSLTQEALSNVVRHAGATLVTIRLQTEPDNCILTISDNGRGYDATKITPGYGLQTIKDHAQMLGAELEINTAPGKGTSYKITYPRQEQS